METYNDYLKRIALVQSDPKFAKEYKDRRTKIGDDIVLDAMNKGEADAEKAKGLKWFLDRSIEMELKGKPMPEKLWNTINGHG